MRGSVRSPHISRLAAAVVAFWLCSTGSAWAGHGGDFGSLQTDLTDPTTGICHLLNVTSCPQLPTITQLVLEIAGLKNAPPEVVRSEGAISPTVAVDAVNPPVGSVTPTLPDVQSKVTPLAFISPLSASPPIGAVAPVTQPGDPHANSFFYAVTNGGTPTMLFLVYDFPPLTNSSFVKGQLVAQISIPLMVLQNNSLPTVLEAPTTIQIFGATGCGNTPPPCVSATATGDFGSGVQTVKASDLGLTVTLTFAPSPNSSPPLSNHAIFGVQAPLLVTGSKDPAYFFSDLAYLSNPLVPIFFPPAFKVDEFGFTPKFLGLPVGIGPYAVPKCFGNCATTPEPSQFPFCARIVVNGVSQPAVAAFFSIGTVGTTYVSAPLVPPTGVTCPF